MKRFIRVFLFLFLLSFSFNAQAISLISDEETEMFVYDILTPVFRAAGLPLNRNYIHIVKDDSLNAFVGDQNHMFIHTGTLLKASNANEIEGVLAHETGHILGGHILRLKIKIQDMQKATLASLIAAAGTAVASGRGDAAIAVVLGTQSSALNAVTVYQMSEERAADETATLLLEQNHKSVKGLKDFMTKIQNNNRLQGIEETPYFRTHPITSERIAFFNEKLKAEHNIISEKTLDDRLKRVQAKLFAYLAPLPTVIKKYPLSDNSLMGKLAHAVYFMRQKDIQKALKYADELISAEPNNPYFWEIKAQALFENGKINEAVYAYKQALNLRPQADLFKLSYAEAVLATEPNPAVVEPLIPLLEQASQSKMHPQAYLYLGKVYDILGQKGTADYFAAEYNYAIGQNALAKKQLDKALKQNLRPDIKLRATDLEQKIKHDTPKRSLF